MKIGDIVVRKSYGKDITFKIIDIRNNDEDEVYVLKGINMRIIADSPIDDLEFATEDIIMKKEVTFNKKVNSRIRNILIQRNAEKKYRSPEEEKRGKNKTVKNSKKSESSMLFGRPGRVLHIDGDPEYLDVCLKTYKQLNVESVGYVISEREQPKQVPKLVSEIRPDIVVLTGHDAIIKGAKEYTDLNNYKNSKYFVQTVSELRTYEPNYDDLVIFAGACQSCYEAILDAGANFASSPNRVLIHCLDPVFICEKIAYTNVGKVVSIHDVVYNTITGVDGVGGLQTRGKYREGFPKSKYS
ncbi:sporulation peptidase YabG [Clostridium botulinum]|uniref:Peptidase n=1 Tax=Clostridium botulinum TaxID=1491 RepID=A0A9Q1V0A7_CLOBO|nr:sporulation peptidase YabG [Clostridium botulinum]AEB76966.1 sporulation peptidase YabG [Clostridium botulinum BKT015925]KEH98400.1 peptidase [Clostridium botulinum D str. 16868]KEI05141.1 peptidase [Clostridium botulinum C/D str. Sp77]KLU75413.1 peptidase [Clostridium botulinum V891]KOA76269.1 peptidase [Clostridium botulinum]